MLSWNTQGEHYLYLSAGMVEIWTSGGGWVVLVLCDGVQHYTVLARLLAVTQLMNFVHI